MNRKQLLFILAALVIIGGAGLILIKQNKESWNAGGAKMGDKVLPDFHPNDVAAIHIKDSTGDLNLVHKGDLWRVEERDEYPANFGRISDVLIKLQGLKVVEAETVGPSWLGHVNLDEPGTPETGGTLVEFKDSQGKLLTALLLGKKHVHEPGESAHAVVAGDADGRYLLVRSDPKNVMLVPDALSSLAPSAEVWLSKDFFKAGNPKSVALTSANDADSWKLTRDSSASPWVLANAKPGELLDTNRASRISGLLDNVMFADVMPVKSSATLGMDKAMTVSVETFDGFTYTLKIARGAENHDYMTVAVAAAQNQGADNKKLQDKLKQERALAPWVYMVNSWVIDPLIQSRPQLLQGYFDARVADAAKAAAEAEAKKKAGGWTPHVIQ